MAQVTGVGGIFFKARDPKALAAWYRDVLGLKIEEWGGSMLRYDAPGHPPHVVWCPFAEDTKYFAPSTQSFMINYAVDDLDALLTHVVSKGVSIINRSEEVYGPFAWILDPEGNKIELWQPKKPPEH